MLKIENTEVLGWEHAIRGMRNPMNSWAKSDSEVSVCECERWPHDVKKSFACLGSNDLDLMKRLRNAGTDHRKFMRMITGLCRPDRPSVLVEGVRHLQSGYGGQFLLYYA